MTAILVTTVFLVAPTIFAEGFSGLSSIHVGQCIVIAILFLNAMLMTAHIVPSTLGPGLQAGSWYALGTLIALQAQGVTGFTTIQFTLAYAAWLALAIGIINSIMAVLKHNKQKGN